MGAFTDIWFWISAAFFVYVPIQTYLLYSKKHRFWYALIPTGAVLFLTLVLTAFIYLTTFGDPATWGDLASAAVFTVGLLATLICFLESCVAMVAVHIIEKKEPTKK